MTDAHGVLNLSDEEKQKVMGQIEANRKTACVCTIANNAQRAQVIYNGIDNGAPIHLAKGETKTGVVIAEHMVARLQEDFDKSPANDPTLEVISWEPAPTLTGPVLAAPPRKPRPAGRRVA